MNIEILGCSGGIGKNLKTTTFLINESLLLDAGTGVELLTLEQMTAIRQVLITHAHLDHIVGLPLMLATIYDAHRQPIDLYALPEVIDALQQHIFNWTLWPDYTVLPEEQPIVRLHKISVGDRLALDEINVTVLPSEHPTPTCGYLLADNHSSFAFSGDTGCNDALWPILNRLQPQLLIIDVSFTNELDELAKLSGHLTPAQLAEQLSRLEYDCEILITHLKPGFEEAIMQQCQPLLVSHNARRLLHNERISL
ncbi:MBL fold metallo-hydrolase [Marinobacterium jannaschii]|uniref:MBL fold metallo-hydrolase n=1 Tax=Marinobacterium jannaschii TaxID=64970 RepID=UPI00048682DC|nr:3',5'-cyclic-nucleotide phosphodiesterase [Marinobacterium jannaschii]